MNSKNLILALADLRQQREQIDSAIGGIEAILKTLNAAPVPAAPVATAAAPVKEKRKYARRAAAPASAPTKPAPAAAPPVQRSGSEPEATDNLNATPLSDAAIKIGRTLVGNFSVTDLQARLDGPKQRAYHWLSAWKEKGWIATVTYGIYKREECFGE